MEDEATTNPRLYFPDTAYIKRSYHWYCMPDYVVAIAMIVTMRWQRLNGRKLEFFVMLATLQRLEY